MTRTIRDAVYDILRVNGMTTVFGNPGSNELPFLKDFPSDFRYVLCLHEGVAVSMAEGFAHASGQTAFVNLHAAAGSGNAMGGLTNAGYSHAPIVVTAGQQVRETVGMEVMLANVDAASLPRPLVKWSAEPLAATDVPRTISEAVHVAALAPAGPVYVSIPYDDWDKDAPGSAELLTARTTQAAGSLSAAQVTQLADRVAAASHPVLILGPDADHPGTYETLVALADVLRCPVWLAPSAPRCPFPTRHPAFRGVLPAGIADLSALLEGHDVALVIGAPVFRYHQYVPGDILPSGTELIQLTCSPSEAGRAPAGDALVGDVGEMSAQLRDELVRRAYDAGERALPSTLVTGTVRPSTQNDRLHPDAVYATLNAVAPEGTIFVSESTSTGDSFWSHIDISRPGSYYNPAAGGLGFGLPATVGAALGAPDRQVVGIIGDGSANFGITALWTAVRMDVPVVVLILNNGTYGALRWFGGVLGTGETPGMDVDGIDFVSVARGYGMDATAVGSVDGLTDALRSALAAGKPSLIEVRTTLS